MISTVLLYAGSVFNLYAVVKNNSVLVQEFIDSLQTPEREKTMALLSYTAENGIHPIKFKSLGDGIWEFKPKPANVRILCFFAPGSSIIMTHGFLKGAKVKTEKKKALQFKEYLEHTEKKEK